MSFFRYKRGTSVVLYSILVIVLLSLVVSSASATRLSASTTAADTEVERWQTLDSMQIGRGDPGLVVYDGKLYTIGGFRSTQLGFLRSTEIYDPLTDNWSVLTKNSQNVIFTIPRSDFVAATVSDNIYVFGGWGGTNPYDPDVLDDTLRLDLVGVEWYEGTLAPMPIPVSGAAGVVIGNQVYILGGNKSQNGQLVGINDVQIYDVPTNTWSAGIPMDSVRNQFQAVLVDGKIFAIGGQDDTDPCMEIFDPVAGEWTAGPMMPGLRYSMGVVALQGKIFVIGGFADRSYSVGLDTMFVYDIASQTWTIGDPMPTARGANRAAIIGQTIYVVGGAKGEPDAGVTLEAYGLFPPPLYIPLIRK